MTQTCYYAGMDVHKRTISFCVKTKDGELVRKGKIPSNRVALKEFVEKTEQPLTIAMEATLFSGWIYDFLKHLGQDVDVGHPFKLRAIADAKKKNDEIDAETLADLRRTDFFPRCYMAPEEMRDLRSVLRFRNLLVRVMVKMKNSAAGLLMGAGVEYSKEKIHGKRYFNKLIDRLDDVPPSLVRLLGMSRSGVEFFQDLQSTLKNSLVRHPLLRERVELLMSIPGVGEVTALTWALEVGEPQRFGQVRDAVSYCGLCSALDSSAGKIKRGPISKQRNEHLQVVLIEAAKLAPRWNPQLCEVHERELKRGNRNRATLAVARKLVAYLMAVDKNREPFVLREEID